MACEKRDSKENNHQPESDNNGSSKFSDFGDDELGISGIGSDNEQLQSPPHTPSPPLTSSPIPIGNLSNKLLSPLSPEKEKRRRSSSWQTKLERRRRKTSSNADDENNSNDLPESPVNYNRQKRHSWWNILVPDNIKHR